MLGRRQFLGAGTALTMGALGLTGCDVHLPLPDGTDTMTGKFHLPEEGDPHLRTFMQWPSSLAVYKNKADLEATQEAIATIASAIARFEPVVMLGAQKHADRIGEWTDDKVEHWAIPTDDLWARDSGPLFVRGEDGSPAIMNFNFNGWGDKQPHGNDALVAEKISERLGIPLIDSGLVGEPGGLEFDGQSTILATESYWVNANRNDVNRDEITKRLCAAVGAEKVIWTKGVKGQDITDYHIDALARFVKPGVILIQLPPKVIAGDPFSKSAWETYEMLKLATDTEGRKFELVVVEEPTKFRSKYEDFLASYVNYYVCNGAVIAAEFGNDKTDAAAEKTLKQLYPDREIVMLNIDPLGEAGGGIHCATQQQPKFES